jgi:hypothetical protein
MAPAPIISIFRNSGGTPAARGVLVAGEYGTAGLFIPWPASLTDNVNFAVYAPASDGVPAEWLTPAEAWILKLPNEPLVGVVVFTEQPTQPGSVAAESQEVRSVIDDPTRSEWDVLKARRAKDLERLRKLGNSAEQCTPPAGVPGKPRILREESFRLGHGICRWLLRAY